MRDLKVCLLILCLFSRQNECAYHYCVQNDFTKATSLRADVDQPEQVRAYPIDKQADLGAIGPLSCKWEFNIAGMPADRPMQLALNASMLTKSAVSVVDDTCGETRMTYSMSGHLCSGFKSKSSFSWCGEATKQLTIVTIPVFSSKNILKVSYQRAAKDNLTGIQELVVSVPKPGYCGRDWLAFNGRCFYKSDNPLTLKQTDSAWTRFGGPRLAVFDSAAQIHQFLLANKNRANESPYRPPLDLSKPVRIGLIRHCSPSHSDKIAARLIYWKSDEFGCFSKQFFNDSSAGLFDYSSCRNATTADCVSLQVTDTNSMKVALAPSDCTAAAISLLSFEESPRPGGSEACPAQNCSVGGENATLFSLIVAYESPGSETASSANVVSIVFIVFFVLFVVSLGILTIYFLRQRLCSQRPQDPQSLPQRQAFIESKTSETA